MTASRYKIITNYLVEYTLPYEEAVFLELDTNDSGKNLVMIYDK